MAKKPIPQPGIMEIDLYVGGKSSLPGHSSVLKLSSNESPYGPSEAAKEAYRRAGNTLQLYPPTDHLALRAGIGEINELDPARIICGAGSDEILQLVVNAYAGPGDEVIYTEHGFSLYPVLIRGAGATPVCVKETRRKVDVDAILASVTNKTRIVFVTNPGNPTGTTISKREMTRLAEGLRTDIVLVLDAAYAEFAGKFDCGFGLADAHDSVIVTRTFSKIYGLGGLRIGWGYAAQSMIDVLNRLRPPFNLSTAQLETALAAVQDAAFTAHVAAENDRLRSWLTDSLRGHGLSVDASSTNFLLVRFKNAAVAQACDLALQNEGIIVRSVTGYGFPNGLRITVGDEAACRRVSHVIGGFLEAQK